MGVEYVPRLDDWFRQRFEALHVSHEARAYLTSLFATQMRSCDGDMSRSSIVLSYATARLKGDFVSFQRIGDWVTWGLSTVPQSFEAKEVVVDLGRLSYYACWRLTNREWKVFEEMADTLPLLSERIRDILESERVNFF